MQDIVSRIMEIKSMEETMGIKQDSNGPRTAQDIMRRFKEFIEIRANTESNLKAAGIILLKTNLLSIYG